MDTTNTRNPGEILIHKSGRFYQVCEESWAVTDAESLYCVGFRNGKQYGPIRKISRAKLQPLNA